jgi:SHS2 domain-containing protein
MAGYRFLDHMTDAVIEAHGNGLEEAFEQAAMGLVDTMVDVAGVRPETAIEIEAEGHDLESLLFDWLDKVMLLLVADGMAMSEFAVRIDGYKLKAVARGERLDLARHKYKVEIKAVTYHEMSVVRDEDDGRVTVRFLLDL